MKNLLRWIQTAYGLNTVGVIVGLLGFAAAMTPSLLPRPPLFTGVLAASGFMLGYGAGVAIYRLYYWTLDKPPPGDGRHTPGLLLYLVAAAVLVTGIILSQVWQNQVRELIGVERADGIALVGILVYFAFLSTLALLVARGVRKVYRLTRARVAKFSHVPRRLATILSLIIATVVIVAVIDGAVLDNVYAQLDARFAAINLRTNAGVEKPVSALRSGGPGSLVDWETLGRHGRSFVGSGPDAKQIAEFTGQSALQPIRVYVSGKQAPNAAARAALAVKELERTGAFERELLIVSTTTGSGWIEPASAAAIEYMHGGNTAHVTIQYSYFPSALALMASRTEATDSGRALFDAVFDRWEQLPEGARPKLIVQGLSLGSFGGQAAFSSAADFAMRSDGALFLGTPGFAQPWRQFTRNRDAGSLEIKPVYRGGRIVRFANDRADLNAMLDDRRGPRVLYLQYATDPICWWSPDLVWHEPDWMREPKGEGVSDSLRWFPVITFLQITLDQYFSNHTPNGHGHNYAPDIVAAWAAVVPPAGWTVEQSDRLQKLIDARYADPL